MPGFGPQDLKGVDFLGSVVATGVCHHGVPLRVHVEGDIVSTFGSPGDRGRLFVMKPEESMCLNVLARRPAAYLAPIGPNHGGMSRNDIYRAGVEGISLGEVIQRGVDEVVLACPANGKLGVPLELKTAGEPYEHIPIPSWVMMSGRLNRVLYGDPLFTPFSAVSPRSSSVLWEVVGETGEGTEYELTMNDPNSPEFYDMFRGDGPMRERIHVRIPLAKAELPTEIVVKAMFGGEEIGTTKVQHAIEYDRFGKASLHIQVNAPALPDYKGNLWRDGVKLTVKAKGWKAAK
jgi:hypothetical protein